MSVEGWRAIWKFELHPGITRLKMPSPAEPLHVLVFHTFRSTTSLTARWLALALLLAVAWALRRRWAAREREPWLIDTAGQVHEGRPMETLAIPRRIHVETGVDDPRLLR